MDVVLHLTCSAVARAFCLQEHETEYAVSPNTPLLTTEVQENAWVCGKHHMGQLAPRAIYCVSTCVSAVYKVTRVHLSKQPHQTFLLILQQVTMPRVSLVCQEQQQSCTHSLYR